MELKGYVTNRCNNMSCFCMPKAQGLRGYISVIAIAYVTFPSGELHESILSHKSVIQKTSIVIGKLTGIYCGL